MANLYYAGIVNRRRVLVVGRTHVNFVVVSRIVERAGMTASAATPEDAIELVRREGPGIVIVDGGAEDGDGLEVLDHLAGSGEFAGGRRPAVIFLATRSMEPRYLGGAVDAVVSKPLTSDRLEPVIFRLANPDRFGG